MGFKINGCSKVQFQGRQKEKLAHDNSGSIWNSESHMRQFQIKMHWQIELFKYKTTMKFFHNSILHE